jgi:DNA-binding response OmpR family regulator
VSTVLIATDADEVFDEVDAALSGTDTTVDRVTTGDAVLAVVRDTDPDLVVLDLQIGNMGGMATCMNLRLEEGGGRLGPQKVLMLLDRTADVFLARRSGADGWLLKPVDALRLRRATDAVLSGGTWTEGSPDSLVG